MLVRAKRKRGGMILRGGRNLSVKQKFALSVVAILALVLQPIYGLAGMIFGAETAFATTSEITQIVFSEKSAKTVVQNSVSSGMIVEMRNNKDEPEALTTSSTKLQLSTSSATGEFSSDGQKNWAHDQSLGINNGWKTRSFHYRDSVPGVYTITAMATAIDTSGDDKVFYTWSATQTMTITATSVSPTPKLAPAVPALTVTPASCAQPKNLAVYDGERTDVRLVVDGIRIEAEKIPAGEFDIAAALAANGQTVNYGEFAGKFVWYDRNGSKNDMELGQFNINLVDPATLLCKDEKPVVTLNSPTDGAYNPTEYIISATDDKQLAIVTGNLYRDGNLVKSCSDRDLATTAHVLICQVPATLADGTYVIRYNARDAANNISTTKESSFSIDRTKPTVTLKPSSLGSAEDSIFRSADFKLYDAMNLAGYKVNGKFFSVSSNQWSDANGIKVGSYHGGIYGKNTIIAVDLAGNESEPLEFYLDNVAPIIEGVENGKVYRGEVAFLTTDQNFKQVTVNGAVVQTQKSSGWSYELLLPISGAGQYDVVATDEAGNETKLTFTINNNIQVVPESSTGSNGVSSTVVSGISSLVARVSTIAYAAGANNTEIATAADEAGASQVATVSDDSAGEKSAADNNGEVLGAQISREKWSLANLLLAIGAVLAAIVALSSSARKDDKRRASRVFLKVLASALAIGAATAIVFTEDFSEAMNWINKWTIMFAAIFVVQLILTALAKKTAK